MLPARPGDTDSSTLTLDPDEDAQVLRKRKDLAAAAALKDAATPQKKAQMVCETPKGILKCSSTASLGSTAGSASDKSGNPGNSASAPGVRRRIGFEDTPQSADSTDITPLSAPSSAPAKTNPPKRRATAAKSSAKPKGKAKAKAQNKAKAKAKATAKALATPPSPPVAATDPKQPQEPKVSVKRSPSAGVQSVLARANTMMSTYLEEEAMDMAIAAGQNLEEHEKKDKQNKKRKRDPASHARRNRFYRTLDSRDPQTPC